MKVLLLDVNCKNNSSTGRIVYDLYTHIRKNGDTAAVCYGRGPRVKEPHIFKFGIDAETALHALMTRITGFTGCFSFFSTRRLLRFIKKFQPDVVHIHELHAYFLNIKPLLRYLRANSIKTIITLHCEFAYTGKCGHSFECEKWKDKCEKCPHLRDYVSTCFFDHTGYMFEQKKNLLSDFSRLTVAAPSLWLSNRAKSSFLKNHPIYTIHNGIDTNIFHPVDTAALREKYGISSDEKVVLALAPNLMSATKGGSWVEKVAQMMKSEKVKFIFVGADGFKEQTKENKLILGRIYDKMLLAQFYSLADVFIICSMKENFPTTCLEAQCCGTTVCGFDAGGTKETILYEPGNSCVPYGDVEALISVLRERLKNVPPKSKIAEMAFNEYSVEHMYEEYSRLYHN